MTIFQLQPAEILLNACVILGVQRTELAYCSITLSLLLSRSFHQLSPSLWLSVRLSFCFFQREFFSGVSLRLPSLCGLVSLRTAEIKVEPNETMRITRPNAEALTYTQLSYDFALWIPVKQDDNHK